MENDLEGERYGAANGKTKETSTEGKEKRFFK